MRKTKFRCKRGAVLTIMIFSLLTAMIISADAADKQMLDAVNRMITPDVSVGHLISYWPASANYQSYLQPSTKIDELIKICDTMVIGWLVCPFKSLESMRFCTNCKIATLTYRFGISGEDMVSSSATAVISSKSSSMISAKYGFSNSRAVIIRQFVKQGSKVVVRGLYANELEAIQDKLSREATLAMKREIMAKTGLSSAGQEQQALVADLYLEESQQLRKLVAQTEYHQTELNNIEPAGFSSVLRAASLGQITDGGVISRIDTIAKAVSRSSFFFAADDSTFFVGSVSNSSGNLLLRLSTFRIKGRLPKGAFATSVGSWKVERTGISSTPSLAQLLAIFPPLKA